MGADFAVPKFHKIHECAELTNLTKYHIRQLVLNEKIKYIKAGKKYLINFESLIAYLQEGDSEVKTRKGGI